jgi:non-ribosomal peptide synthetase component E (peptide arylation enzyme)
MSGGPLDGVVPWPPELARRYRERGYWTGETLGEVFDRSVAAHAGRVAVVDGERRVTYRQLGTLVDRLALHLAERGISRQQRVVFQLPNVLEFIVAYFACWCAAIRPCRSTCSTRAAGFAATCSVSTTRRTRAGSRASTDRWRRAT